MPHMDYNNRQGGGMSNSPATEDYDPTLHCDNKCLRASYCMGGSCRNGGAGERYGRPSVKIVNRHRPTLDEMAYLSATAEERKDGYVKAWLKNPEFRDALKEVARKSREQHEANLEKVGRAIDPMGWLWYDRADDDHPAKPVFRQHSFTQAQAAINAIRAINCSKEGS